MKLINGSNTDIIIGVDNTDNTAIVAENADNTATDAENIDNEVTNAEVAKQHYRRFNQYIKFQTKSGNIRDQIAEAIELFEHTLDKKALVWFQEHKDKFVDVTTLKMMFLQRYNPWGKTKRDQLQSWNILIFDSQKTDVEHFDLINTLGDMLGQTAESKMEKFKDTMPTIIQSTSCYLLNMRKEN